MSEVTPTYDKAKITVQGLQLLTRIMLTGASLKLTRAAIGEGVPDGEPSALTALVKEVPSHKSGEEGTSATVDFQTFAATDDTTACMRVNIQNGDTAFTLREIGIYAQDPDGDEILYAYTCDRSKYAMPFPSNSDGAHVSETVDIPFFVVNTDTITIEADITLPAEVSLVEFNEHRLAGVLDHPDGSVTTDKLADRSVTTDKLADRAVTWDKLDFNVQQTVVPTTKLKMGGMAPVITVSNGKRINIVFDETPTITFDGLMREVSLDTETMDFSSDEAVEAGKQYDLSIAYDLGAGHFRFDVKKISDSLDPVSEDELTPNHAENGRLFFRVCIFAFTDTDTEADIQQYKSPSTIETMKIVNANADCATYNFEASNIARVGTWVDGTPVWRAAIPITPLKDAGITRGTTTTIEVFDLLRTLNVIEIDVSENVIYIDSMLRLQNDKNDYRANATPVGDVITDGEYPGKYNLTWNAGDVDYAEAIYGWVEFATVEDNIPAAKQVKG